MDFFFFSFGLLSLPAGCSSVPQHNILQLAIRKHPRVDGGRAPRGQASGHPRRHPQDAQRLRDAGWREGSQTLRCAPISPVNIRDNQSINHWNALVSAVGLFKKTLLSLWRQISGLLLKRHTKYSKHLPEPYWQCFKMVIDIVLCSKVSLVIVSSVILWGFPLSFVVVSYPSPELHSSYPGWLVETIQHPN